MKNTWKIFVLVISSISFSQAQDKIEEVTIDGHIVKALISEGDTILLATLDEMSVTSPRSFDNKGEERHYRRMKYNALKVYPYAVTAIKTYRELEDATLDLKKRKKKKHIKKLQKQLEEEFKMPLKKLTKTQGKILVKMIERELGVPCYNVVRELKGGVTAYYWQGLGKMWGYDLQQGYNPEEDPVLEYVLSDLNISHKKEED